ncbi:MAG: ATP-binding protein [Candidatus Riflebacteria bacterium]|nr:ATP-binding protein [Candidatus Riflebacteria bacterium]
MRPDVRERLRILNPWLTCSPGEGRALLQRFLPARYVARRASPRQVGDEHAVIVVGPRQAGKSTLTWHHLEPLFPSVLFLNAEDTLVREACASAGELADLIRRGYPGLKVVFLEEAQHLTEAGLLVKGLVDARLGVQVWVTGSSSYHLCARTRETLAGRATRVKVLPFSLPELLAHEAGDLGPEGRNSVADRLVARQLILGSFPAVWLAGDDGVRQRLLFEYVESFVLRDASDVHRVRNVPAFRRLLGLIAVQMGNLVNLAALGATCGVDAATIDSYLEILDESHVVTRLRPYAGGRRRELTQAPKLYFVDSGLRNALRNDFSPELATRIDAGALLENWAFAEITKCLDLLDGLGYWRSTNGAEVDFVIEHAGEVAGLEVKASVLRRPEITRSSRSFLEAYKPRRFAVLNLGLHDSVIEVGQTAVAHLTPRTFHTWLETILGRGILPLIR